MPPFLIIRLGVWLSSMFPCSPYELLSVSTSICGDRMLKMFSRLALPETDQMGSSFSLLRLPNLLEPS